MSVPHTHVDEEQTDAAARAFLAETAMLPNCSECAAAVEQHARYLSLVRLVGRDTREPVGDPGVAVIRALRRRTFPARATRQMLSLLGGAPAKAVRA